ncbi:arginase [Janthinobacterium sp. BJB426]|uniref:arginase family protein n=1 Tax=Janthinobacterium sp. BJB426 TaxID=2048010 RepID=UPI000C0EF4E9|nr:arginase family protein [Janthinobacterium sp. BJB426]PHV29059.1 arginase [Janthinobacterium sp. BJB426]
MEIILAPSNLGLRPLAPGHEPGTWRAPAVLMAQGLEAAVGARTCVALPRPAYTPMAQPGTRLYNGVTMRAFNLELAARVADSHARGVFPLVIGGDCSVLLGALTGARSAGGVSLVHVDGHSDFRHPGNYDPAQTLGAVAGMDLALATGRGEALMTQWPGVTAPLVAEEYVVQLGERENRDADFAWPDVNDTAITRIDVFEANAAGAAVVAERINAVLDRRAPRRFWLHLDVDVLDQALMPAVDSPGSPGIAPDALLAILRTLLDGGGCCGMTVTVFDPDKDPDGACTALLVALLGQLFAPAPVSGRVADMLV